MITDLEQRIADWWALREAYCAAQMIYDREAKTDLALELGLPAVAFHALSYEVWSLLQRWQHHMTVACF